MLASENGRAAAVRLLLGAGADANAADADGWTPLAFAARGGHIAIAKDLLDAGAKVDSRDCVSMKYVNISFLCYVAIELSIYGCGLPKTEILLVIGLGIMYLCCYNKLG